MMRITKGGVWVVVLLNWFFSLGHGIQRIKSRSNHSRKVDAETGSGTGATYPTLPDEKCRICEDVAQTFHDRFKCMGNYMFDNSVALDEFTYSGGFKSCQSPIFQCNHIYGGLRNRCFQMRTELIGNDTKVWASIKQKVSPMGICITQGYCDPEDAEPPPEGNFGKRGALTDADANENLQLSCQSAFDANVCKKDIRCPLYTDRCSEPCYLCTMLVMNFPKFQEACAPPESEMIGIAGYKGNTEALPSAVHADSGGKYAEQKDLPKDTYWRPWGRLAIDDSPNSLLETQAKTKTKLEALSTSSSSLPSLSGSGSGSGSGPIGERDIPLKKRMPCYDMYDRFTRSRKMRYFTSWKRTVVAGADAVDGMWGTMWDANIACKCMGMCPVEPGEDLALANTCRYSTLEEKAMQYVFNEFSLNGR
mmetsp:Transcript_29567/g.51919  ORF Transcript_29567/g.51919 Transcript_29567/m.51919 type:complete len:420 (+) Transcript_29567:101-1360(+)